MTENEELGDAHAVVEVEAAERVVLNACFLRVASDGEAVGSSVVLDGMEAVRVGRLYASE